MNPSDKDRSSSVLRGLRRYGPLERGLKPVARNVPRQCTNGIVWRADKFAKSRDLLN